MSKITVFSTQTCHWCVQLKQYLKSKNIDFKNIDVSEDGEWANKMFERSHHMGVPQMWVGENTVVGFDIERINQLLEIK